MLNLPTLGGLKVEKDREFGGDLDDLSEEEVVQIRESEGATGVASA